MYRTDSNAPQMLGLLDELFSRKINDWYTIPLQGYYIKEAQTLDARLKLARSTHSWDCQRNHSLLFMCLITKHDGVDLQEWLTYQILVFGAHHIFVYVNDPEGDNTWLVLRPFIDAGFVTAFNFTGIYIIIYNSLLNI